MKNPIERMLEEHREHLNPHHLFSVSNQDIDEQHRKKTMLPGHMAEGFIFNKNYLVEYIGPNAKSTPALREEKEKAALQSAKDDLEAMQRRLNSAAPLASESESDKNSPEISGLVPTQNNLIQSSLPDKTPPQRSWLTGVELLFFVSKNVLSNPMKRREACTSLPFPSK